MAAYCTSHTVHFSGQNIETIVTNMPSWVDEWINQVQRNTSPLIVGLDCEWKPEHTRSISNKMAILQLCVKNKCLIVQIFHMAHIPDSLKNFLRYSNSAFVGVDIGRDVSKLRDDYGLIVSNAVDVEPLAMTRLNYYNNHLRIGLKRLALEFAGLEMEKPQHVTMSNWEARVLSHEQIVYACIDAFASYMIGYKLLG